MALERIQMIPLRKNIWSSTIAQVLDQNSSHSFENSHIYYYYYYYFLWKESNLRRLISFKPRLMLNMHGSCFRGDGAAVLERLLHKMKAIHLKNRDTQH